MRHSVKLMAADDDLDLEQLYEDHAQALFAYLVHLTRNEADTRDVLQEIFVKLARQPDRLRGVRAPRAFLLRLAHNAAVDLMRRTSARVRASDAATQTESAKLFAPTDDPDEASFRSALEMALKELPEDQRAVVYLKLWEGLTFERIAETLGIPPNTAASRYRYGIDKLRQLLRPLYEEIQ